MRVGRLRRLLWLLLLSVFVLADEAADDDSTRPTGVHTRPKHRAAPTPLSSPQPVGPSYPFISSVSSFLAAKFERDHLSKASLAATNFVLVAALAEQTTADVVSRQEARMPFGGFTLPVERTKKQHGRLYILCGLVEVSWASATERKVNPWPEWRVLCGKLFRAHTGETYLIRSVTPNRESVELDDPRARTVVEAAVSGLNQLPKYQHAATTHKLAAVLSVERQTVQQRHFRRLALSHIPGDIDLFFVSFLTSDDSFGMAPPVPHIAAVMRSAKTGVKVVRQISLGESGYTILRGVVGIQRLTVFQFNAKAQRKFQKAVAAALTHGTDASDVQITSVDVLKFGMSASAADVGHGSDIVADGNTARGRRRLFAPSVAKQESETLGMSDLTSPGFSIDSCEGYTVPASRLMATMPAAATGAMSTASATDELWNATNADIESPDAALLSTAMIYAERQAEAARLQNRRLLAQAGQEGVKVRFTLSVAGSAGDVLAVMNSNGFITKLSAGMREQGILGVQASDVSFASRVLLSNRAVPQGAGLTFTQLIIIISAFVLGVLVTTIRAAHLRLKQRRAEGF